jgi:Phosphotransferase enzyme family
MKVNHPEWPDQVTAHLVADCGELKEVDRVAGQSRAEVWCARFERKTVIVKKTSVDREVDFYRVTAASLRKAVPIPKLEWIYEGSEHSWLVLEHIPRALPRERWLADASILHSLYRLHSFSQNVQTMFRPMWSEEMSGVAASFFPDLIKKELEPILYRLRIDAQHLFDPLCYISGDPNPTNWALRLNGEAVLFDWERFGRGHPALDLAITVPGLGREEDFHRVAIEYLKVANLIDSNMPEWRRNIALAKLWSVVEFLYFVRIDTRSDINFGWLLKSIPAWLRDVDTIARTS